MRIYHTPLVGRSSGQLRRRAARQQGDKPARLRFLDDFIDDALGRSVQQSRPYHHLASALARLGYLTTPKDLRQFVYPSPRVGLSARLAAVQAAGLDSAVEVIYVQPEATPGVRAIDFAQFAEFVGRYPDPLSQTFAPHLLKWRAEAGSSEPL